MRDPERRRHRDRRAEPRRGHAERPAEHRARARAANARASRSLRRIAPDASPAAARRRRPRARAAPRTRTARAPATMAARRSPQRPPPATQERRQRAALSAAYTPPAVHSRPGASIAREQSATFTASPSRAGAKVLTSEPIPSRAAAWRGQIRPPAAPKGGRPGADGARERRREAERREAEPPRVGAAQGGDGRGEMTPGRAREQRDDGDREDRGRTEKKLGAGRLHARAFATVVLPTSHREGCENVKIQRGMRGIGRRRGAREMNGV